MSHMSWPGGSGRGPITFEQALESVLHGVALGIVSGNVVLTRSGNGCTMTIPGGAPLDEALALIGRTVDHLRHGKYQVALRVSTGGPASRSIQLNTVDTVRAWLESEDGRKCRRSSAARWTIEVTRPAW